MAVEFWKIAVPKPAGFTVTVCTPKLKQIIFAFGTSVGFEDVALNVKLSTGVSASEIVIRKGPDGISTSVLRSCMAAIVGDRLPTASTNEALALLDPSLTVTVIV